MGKGLVGQPIVVAQSCPLGVSSVLCGGGGVCVCMCVRAHVYVLLFCLI